MKTRSAHRKLDGTPSDIRSICLITADSETLVRFRSHMIEALLADGIAIHYVGPVVDDRTRAWLTERSIGIHVIPISRNSLSPFSDLATFFAIWRALRRIAPDTAIAIRIKSTVFGLPAAALCGVRYRFVFVTGLGYAFTRRSGSIAWRIANLFASNLYRFGLRFATAVAFQNADDERDFRAWRLLPAKVPSTVVHGSGVDIRYFEVAALPDDPSCLFMARLLRDKGIEEYIAAARIVRAAVPSARFSVIGPPETNPSAFPLDAIRAAEREGMIEYHGAVDDVRPFVAAARIFVLPSYYREGTPRSILEAMAMGRPIITTDLPGCRDTVDHGRNGLLVPPRDADRLAAAILELVNDPSRAAAMGRESRQIVEKKYEIGRITNSLLGFFWSHARQSAPTAP